MMNSLPKLPSCLFLVLFSVSLTGQIACDDDTVTAPAPEGPSAGLGAVLGYAYDNLDRRPIPGATITTDPATITVHSDADGVFRLNNVPMAAYILNVSHSEYQTKRMPLAVETGQVSNVYVWMSSSSPDTLTLLASVSTGGGCVGVAAQGILVCASGQAGLQVFDLTNPSSPALLGTISMTSGYIGDVEIHGDAVYVCNNTGNVEIVDVTTATAPVKRTPFYVGGKSHDSELDGDLLVVANNDSIVVIDASQAFALKRLGAVATAQDGLGQGNFGIGLDTVRHVAILGSYNNGVEVVDYSNPSAPKKVGSLGSGMNPWDCDVNSATSSAVVASDDGLEFINYAQPNNPQRIARWAPGGNGGRDVKLVGSLAIFAQTFNGLRLMDISNPALVHTRQRLQNDVGSPGNIAVEGTRVYVASGDKLLVYSLPPSAVSASTGAAAAH